MAKKTSAIAPKPEMTSRRQFLLAAGALLILTLALFADLLWSGGQAVVSHGGDLRRQFAYWRDFGFSQLAQGNMALWNPHVFCGAPFLAGFQSALLYPPNWMFMVLPLAAAINVSVALHVYLLGLFMYLWTHCRGLHPVACFFAAAVAMLGDSYMMHVFSGHLPHLCAMTWAPLLLLAIDGMIDRPSLRWGLVGALALAMMILAGHPQYLFFGLVAALVYGLLQLVRARRRGWIVLSFGAMSLVGLALAAAQLLPSFRAVGETIRSGAMPFDFVANTSLPYANLLTAVAPGVFGNDEQLPYWGAWYYWEVSIYVGVAAGVLAAAGACYGHKRTRRFSVVMTLVLLVLALGSNTPLLKVLYTFVPGFDKFRCPARFGFFMVLFVGMLAAIGLDVLIRRPPAGKRLAVGVLLAAAALAAGAGWAYWSSLRGGSSWASTVAALGAQNNSAQIRQLVRQEDFPGQAGSFAAGRGLIAAGLCAGVGGMIFLRRYGRAFAWLIAVVGLAELFVVGHSHRGSFDLATIFPDVFRQFYRQQSGDYRVLNVPVLSDSGMSLGADDIWGYDSFLLRRTTELMASGQGIDPNGVDYFDVNPFKQRLFPMVRCKYVFAQTRGGVQLMPPLGDPLPRVLVLSDYRVLSQRDEVLAAVNDPLFDPRKTVILEAEPNIRPAPAQGQAGTAKVIASTTDSLTIEADVKQAAILLITDAYSAGWHVRPLEGPPAQEYQLLPADWALRAVPLAAGRHHFRLEYVPAGWTAGKWISIVAVVVFGGLAGWQVLSARGRKHRTGERDNPS